MDIKKLSLSTIGILVSFSSLWAEDTPKAWAHESEAQVVIVGGNSETETYSAKQETKYRFTENELTLKAQYLYGKIEEIKGAENWSFSLRYDRYLSDRFSLFVAHGWSGDQFAGYDHRHDTDIGAKFYWIKNDDKNYLFSELGYRYGFIDYAYSDDTDSAHIIRFYSEAAHTVTESLFAKLWIEALPDVKESENFVFKFEPSLNFTVSKYFTFKAAYQGTYDGLPAVDGLKKYDHQTTLALVAKY